MRRLSLGQSFWSTRFRKYSGVLGFENIPAIPTSGGARDWPSGGSQRGRAQRWPLTGTGEEQGGRWGGNLGPPPPPPASGAGSPPPPGALQRPSWHPCPRHVGARMSLPPHHLGRHLRVLPLLHVLLLQEAPLTRPMRVSRVTNHAPGGGTPSRRSPASLRPALSPLGARTAPGARGPLLAHRQIFPGGWPAGG